MKTRKSRYFVGDFETTTYKGQQKTEVWASASVELGTEDVQVFHSIGEQFDYFVDLNSHVVALYHNLKFDGCFWLSYLIVDKGFKQATAKLAEDSEDIEFLEPDKMPNNTVAYSISSMGQWYKIVVKVRDKIIEFRDSLKLLPFSVERIGQSFKTKHRKLNIEYKGLRYAGCEITPQEEEYIKNDVLVVKEAIELMFSQGHNRLTIGSCCLHEYRRIIGRKTYDRLFPNMYDVLLTDVFGAANADAYIRRSYHGGWCYLAKGKQCRKFYNGTTADVNSLYPSMMHSESGNLYPIGNPTFWSGNYVPEEAIDGAHYYFLRIRTRFYLKPGKLPFVQIKNTLSYRANEMLETSDMYNPADGKYYTQYYDLDNKLQEAIVTLTLTMTDFRLLVEHYDLEDFEILDGCYFDAALGIFDDYIDKYRKIKMESKGAQRELAKLFLNNLYGKMASSKSSNFKVAYVKDDGVLGFYTQLADDKIPGYIPVGSAITSYARNFTIRAAQANYHGPDQPGFIYADTDSIHCDLAPGKIVGIKVDPTAFCCWKLETSWDVGYFVRQKTYLEHVVAEDLEPIENPWYNIKCAGMPERCKELFLKSMLGVSPDALSTEEREKYTPPEIEFLKTRRTIEDFDVGLKVPGKLLPRRIRGGIVLTDTTYQMR